MELTYLIRKLGHVTVYFILTLFIFRALHKKKQPRFHWKKYVIAFILTLSYAMLDEYHQSLTGFRDGRWMDVGIDGIGIILGATAFHFLIHHNRENKVIEEV